MYVARLPPTPLAFGNSQVDALWHSVRGSLADLGTTVGIGRLQEGVHSLQEGLSERAHHLQEEISETVHHLSERAHHLQEEISETVHHLQEGLSETAHHLQEEISETVHHLTERARSLQEGVKHHIGLPGSAAAFKALSGRLSWPAERCDTPPPPHTCPAGFSRAPKAAHFIPAVWLNA